MAACGTEADRAPNQVWIVHGIFEEFMRKRFLSVVKVIVDKLSDSLSNCSGDFKIWIRFSPSFLVAGHPPLIPLEAKQIETMLPKPLIGSGKVGLHRQESILQFWLRHLGGSIGLRIIVNTVENIRLPNFAVVQSLWFPLGFHFSQRGKYYRRNECCYVTNIYTLLFYKF